MINIDFLRNSCRIVIEEGWSLQAQLTIDESRRCCCPLGAAAIVSSVVPNYCNLTYTLIGHHIGMTFFEADGFVRGFDSGDDYSPDPIRGEEYLNGFAAGAQLRKEFLGEYSK